MVKTYNTIMDVFNDPFLIGFTREFERLSSITNANSKVSYPPYNLVKIDEDNYRLDLAVAGFSKEDLEVTVKDGALIITGNTADSDDEIVYRGIATRKFTRSFALGEFMEVEKAKMDNGILSIPVVRIVPDEKKPKQITIK
jgi:molecular chaperone IbpA